MISGRAVPGIDLCGPVLKLALSVPCLFERFARAPFCVSNRSRSASRLSRRSLQLAFEGCDLLLVDVGASVIVRQNGRASHKTLLEFGGNPVSMSRSEINPESQCRTPSFDAPNTRKVDSLREAQRSWGAVQRWLTDVLRWCQGGGHQHGGTAVFPGLEELFSLLQVLRQVRSGQFDAVVVDLRPHRRDAAAA